MNEDLKADLHVHTTASDGTFSPRQAVTIAKEVGLAAMAIADHDTDAGVDEALIAGEELGVEVVPALEINTEVNGREMHILGYMVRPVPERLAALLGKMREAREGRIEEMVRRLNLAGVKVSAENVRRIAGSGVIGRPHVARAMVEAGQIRTVDEAFEIYLNIGRPCYVERYKITPLEAVRELSEAKAIPVLAHPVSARHDDLIPGLIRAGLKGIEVYHPDHDRSAEQKYLQIAVSSGLLATGGSDSHGRDGRGPTIGRTTVPYSTVLRMKEMKAKLE